MLKSNKRIIIIIAIAFVILTGITLKIFFFNTKASNTNQTINSAYSTTIRDTTFQTDNSGNLNITRNKVKTTTNESKDESWTVLFYMDGCDLESGDAIASEALGHIREINLNKKNIKNLNLIVQSGGCSYWHDFDFSTTKIQRHKLNANRRFETVDEQPLANMGDPDTLANFLEWGVTTYPATNYMLVFWDHGGDSTRGICIDELYDDDPLTMGEIEYAFASIKNTLTKPFDIITFDTCSSGSIEMANALAPYANYMIASPEVISSYGLYYYFALQEMIDNPSVEPLEIGKKFCDNYDESSSKSHISSYATLATYDLNSIDNFLTEFNKILKYVYEESSKDEDSLSKMNRIAKNTWKYDCKEQIDIGDYLNKLNKQYDTSACLDALESLVAYRARGPKANARDISSISFLHPSTIMTFGKINKYRNICISPYYLKYLELTAHIRYKNDYNNFQSYKWDDSEYFHEKNFDFLNYIVHDNSNFDEVLNLLKSNDNYTNDDFIDTWEHNFQNQIGEQHNEATGSAETDTINVSTDDGNLKGTIKDTPEDIYCVYNSIFSKWNDELICLGQDAKATYDNKTGEINTNFNGEWLMLGDGQLLTTYVDKIDDNTIIYSIPVIINTEECTILIEETDNNFNILGYKDSTQYSEYQGRVFNLEPNTNITPIYDIWDDTSDTYTSDFGEEYTYTGNNDFLFTELNDDTYYYSIILEDISGSIEYSKQYPFNIKDNQIVLQ